MARMNIVPVRRTHEGGRAEAHQTPLQELRRSVLTALLWEDTFYEKGSAHAGRVANLVAVCDPQAVADLAIEARTTMFLRHAPLYLIRCLAATKAPGVGRIVAATLPQIIQRPDELTEYVAMYWPGQASRTSRRPAPLSAGSKRGLAVAFRKFGAYALAKYDRDSAAVKLRDVLRLVHAHPGDPVALGSATTFEMWDKGNKATPQTHRVSRHVEGKGALWGKVITRTLEAPGTWENRLSAGEDKKAVFEDLLAKGELGALATLRNLRNMIEAGVNPDLVNARLAGKLDKVLPFRYLAAARHAKAYAAALNDAMLRAVADEAKLPGSTAVVVDVSGSMDDPLSKQSEMTRMDAACGVAVLVREIATTCRVFSFSTRLVEVANHRGIPLADAISGSQSHGGTHLAGALQALRQMGTFDRVIVITDEQAHDDVAGPQAAPVGYVINVATYQHGVRRSGWTHIDGWSERVVDFIRAEESLPATPPTADVR